MKSLETTADIIAWFEILIGDATSLSSADSLRLLQEIYDDCLEQKEWEFLKKEATGSIAGTEIPAADDFNRLLVEPYIYIGSHNQPYKVIPYSERRLYTGQNHWCYYDARQQKFVFPYEINDTY